MNIKIILLISFILIIMLNGASTSAKDDYTSKVTDVKFTKINTNNRFEIYDYEENLPRSFKIKLLNNEILPDKIENYSTLKDVVPRDKLYYIIQINDPASFRNDYAEMLANVPSLLNVVNIWQNQSLTVGEIRNQVELYINGTKT